MKSKRHYCEACTCDSLWDATSDWDADGSWRSLWECRCCHATIPRRVLRKQRKHEDTDRLIAELCAPHRKIEPATQD